MKISVALCTYNGERFLAEQLASIRRQTRVPDEVVIRDDGSTDGTARIVEAFARDYPGTVDFAVNPRRRGVTGNFEAALAAATGGLILLSDQDDVWFPDRVDRAERAFEADPELLLLFADARLVDASGRPLGSTLLKALGVTPEERNRILSDRAFEVLAKRSMALGAATCLRRTVLGDALPIPPSWMHDEWVALIASARGRVACVDEPVIDYRQHDANVVGRPPMSLRELYASVCAPRRDFRIDMVERVASLGARLQTMNAPREHLALCAEKLQHVRIRGSLPPLRPMRVVPILREAWTGRYRRYSTGWRAILVDLFGPIATR
jgi:glycosyltransferase involved in cell wall biosynthesis